MAAVQDLSLRQLQYVVAVADTLGFHRAAARCGVSQPTLSAQVRLLEDVLGVAIFERDKRRVLVTPAGEAIVARARKVLLDTEDLLGAAARAKDPFAATHRIGIIPTIAPYLLPEITPLLAKKYPRMQLRFREAKTEDVVRDLGSGALDAGIVADVPELGELSRAEIRKDPFVVALPHGHALAKKKRIAASDLEDQPVLLLDDGHCFRSQALGLCARAGAKELEFRATSLATLAQMVSSGAGITLLPELAVPVENRRGQLEIRPLTPETHRTLALVWRPQSPFSDAFGALAKGLRRSS
jgi:LysR family hydrogen peroxide-inducible transcriptional activator